MLGEFVTLSIDDNEDDWQVVGIVRPALSGDILRTGTGYINYNQYASVVHIAGKAQTVQIVAIESNATTQAELAQVAEDYYKSRGIAVQSVETISEILETIGTQFNILLIALSVIVRLLAFVGALGLAGTMSLNVLEREREVGVMRATGAREWTVLQAFIVEGVFIGLLSWPVSVVLAVPLTLLYTDLLGTEFLGSPLTYAYTPLGVVLWFLIVIVLSILASFVPAWRATQLTVREILAQS